MNPEIEPNFLAEIDSIIKESQQLMKNYTPTIAKQPHETTGQYYLKIAMNTINHVNNNSRPCIKKTQESLEAAIQ